MSITGAGIKASNPKDAIGTLKVSLSYMPSAVVMETALGMMEGGWKYGRHNYRQIGVRASVYYDASMRHLMAWWEGEDHDGASRANLHHISKAIASLVVLRDAMLNDKWVDDRPPAMKPGWIEDMNVTVETLAKAFPEPIAPYTQVDNSWVPFPPANSLTQCVFDERHAFGGKRTCSVCGAFFTVPADDRPAQCQGR